MIKKIKILDGIPYQNGFLYLAEFHHTDGPVIRSVAIVETDMPRDEFEQLRLVPLNTHATIGVKKVLLETYVGLNRGDKTKFERWAYLCARDAFSAYPEVKAFREKQALCEALGVSASSKKTHRM